MDINGCCGHSLLIGLSCLWSWANNVCSIFPQLKMIHFYKVEPGDTCRCDRGLRISTCGHPTLHPRRSETSKMSLSKEEATGAAAEQPEPRRPKCTRCRHHGIIVPQKGHVKFCPFLKCDCWKCYLITQRTRITTLQRNLKRAQSKPPDDPQRPCSPAGLSGREPAAEAAPGASAPSEGTRPPVTSGLMCPRSDECPGAAAATTRSPEGVRGRAAAGGEHVAGLGSKELPPLTSSEGGRCSSYSAPYFSEIGQTPPLPVIHFPFQMPGHYPGSYGLFPNFLFSMPQLPPAGFYNDSFCSARIFPHFQQGAVHYPPPPETGPQADYRQVFSIQPPLFPEAFKQELMSRQYPKHSEPDTEKVD